jgi:ABC-type dipeptide/oligopeptide/nickel transport system permease subunit
MTTFLLRRIALIVPTLFFVSLLIFGLQQLLPGDPATALAGEDRDPAVIAFLRQKYHLDEPLPVRYALWVEGVARGDLGESIRIKRPVLDLIAEKLPVTGELALMALIIALAIGLPAGIIAAVKKGTAIDYGASMAALWGLSIPNFWLGILLILLFSVRLGLLPASGFVSPGESLKQNLLTMIMPAFVLGNAIAAGMMRHTRSAMLQVLSADFVRTARAKGLPEIWVILRHALRNALIPVVTLVALDFGALLSGAVLTEQVFTIPGFGKLIVDAGVQSRLRGRARRRALYSVCLHPAQSCRRHRLCRAEPAFALMATEILAGIATDEPVGEPPWVRAVRRVVRRPTAMIGVAVAVLFILAAVAAPLLAPYDPLATNWAAVRKAPSALHLFGTDEIGRDVLSRIIWGGRASLLAGLVSVLLALAVGVPIGLISGYVGGVLDGTLMRFIDAMLAIPFLILAIALAAFLGPSLTNAMIAIGVTQMPIFARLTRAQVLSVKHEDYIEAARAVGNPQYRIVLRHIFPNIVPPLLVQATLASAAAIIAEASLSFLGLGQQPPDPSWGSMLNTAKNFMSQAPWMAVWPGLAIFSLVLSLNLFGDGLRDALDPRR